MIYPISIYQKLFRYLSTATLFLSLVIGYLWIQRFGIYRISSKFDLPEFPLDCYVLIDWQWQKGRSLRHGDLIILDYTNQQPIIAQVTTGFAISDANLQTKQKASFNIGTPENYYWVKKLTIQESIITLIPLDKIKGRILMVLWYTE